MDLNIVHDATTHQFVAEVEGQHCYLQYRINANHSILDMHHTFVPESLRGRNIAQAIVDFALVYAKAHHFKVIPSCPFVKKYIDRHPEYQTLLVVL